jgi:hypothetical protein
MITKCRSYLLVTILLATAFPAAFAGDPAVVDIGDRRELFVDDFLIDRLDGTRLALHAPRPAEKVLTLKRPWEGIYSGYFTVIKDGEGYLIYYRGMPEAKHTFDVEVTCVAQSDDGIHWTKPNLGLFEVRGSRQNNVILARHRACHNFSPLLDTNPAAPPAEKFKALGGTGKPGLVALTSPDGIHWKDIQKEPVITEGAFDSQNVAFWSDSEQCYVCYFRIFKDGKRWVSRCTSKDFRNWTEPVEMGLDGKPREHLYTNQTAPYVRAPHIYIGTPTRFFPGRRVLSDEVLKEIDTPTDWKYHNDCADIVFTSARGGSDFKRTFLEAFIRPGRDPRNWTSRASYAALGIHLSGPDELSLWVQHNCGYSTSHIRRYTMRVDGFVSVQAPYAGGRMVTKPFAFKGGKLTINYASSAGGGLRVEIQDASGQPIKGFAETDCPEIIGDQIARTVSWKGGSDVSSLAGKPIRLRFAMRDADLFSIQFVD